MFTNNIVPTPANVFADFVEPSGDWYSRQPAVYGETFSDADGGGTGAPSLLARIAMGVFTPLLATPMPSNRLGWQVVGVARVPETG